MESNTVHVTANFRPNAMNYLHNKRDKDLCKKEKNIDLSHYHETIIDCGNENTFFNKIFEEAVKEYNKRQKRSDRKIKNEDYLTHIKSKKLKSNHKNLNSDGKIKPVTEIEFKIGNRDNQWPNRKQLYKVLKLFVKKFELLYGKNIKVVGAFLYDDEYSISKDKKKNKIFNPPHLHMDIVYIGHSLTDEEIKIEDADRERIRLEKIEEYKKEGKKWNENLWKKTDWTEYRVKKFGKALRNGLSENCSMSAALAELGFHTSTKKQTAQIQFEHEVHKQFQDFCEDMGINVDRTKVESHKHVSPEVLAQINENKKLEKEIKKQELQNKHNRRILEKETAEVKEIKQKLRTKQKDLDDASKKLEKKETALNISEKNLKKREKNIIEKETYINARMDLATNLQNTVDSIKNELDVVNIFESKAKDHYRATSNFSSAISIFSKGVKKLVTGIKYELEKYKDAFKDFFNFSPKKFRTLADSMEKNNCETYKAYHDKFELGKLDWQEQRNNTPEQKREYRGR